MTYDILERKFYASEKRTMWATRQNDIIIFTAGEDDMRLINNLSKYDRERLYELITLGGMLDPNQKS